MSDDAPASTVEDTASAPAIKGGADSIAKVLQSSGPVVTCVLLRHMLPNGKDSKPHAVIPKQVAESVAAAASLDSLDTKTSSKTKKGPAKTPPPSPRNHHHQHHHQRPVLTELVEEVQVDTTPSAKGVEHVLGGPFTFIGQYPTEGVMLMKRADQLDDVDRDLEGLSVQHLKALCLESPDIDFDETATLEMSDLVEAIRGAQLPINPHQLQPPFDKEVIRGDILVLKVADTDDEEDEDVDENPVAAMAKAMSEFHAMTNVSNDEFFLNYSKEEYVALNRLK